MKAIYKIDTVKDMVRNGSIFWAMPGNSVNHVSDVLKLDLEEAKAFIKEHTLNLHEADFFESRLQRNCLVADIYKIFITPDMWYIKFAIDKTDPEFLYYMSFHKDREI